MSASDRVLGLIDSPPVETVVSSITDPPPSGDARRLVAESFSAIRAERSRWGRCG